MNPLASNAVYIPRILLDRNLVPCIYQHVLSLVFVLNIYVRYNLFRLYVCETRGYISQHISFALGTKTEPVLLTRRELGALYF